MLKRAELGVPVAGVLRKIGINGDLGLIAGEVGERLPCPPRPSPNNSLLCPVRLEPLRC